MSFLGVGAVLDAASRGRYMARQMASIRAPHVRLRHGNKAAADMPAAVDEWEPHACFHLCLDCGYLAEEAGAPCPGCGHTGWVDLRRTADADQICAMERRNRRVVPQSLARWGMLLAVVLGLGVAAASVWSTRGHLGVTSTGSALVGLILGAFAAGVGSWLVPRLLVFLVYRRKPTFPQRWHLPLPLPGVGARPASVAQGEARASGDLLQAPLSGTPCVAYEVSVLFDTPGDLRPPMWILEEERSVAFTLDGREVPADRVTLDLPIEPVGEDTPEGDRAVALFLRKRGLFYSEGEYTLFEALVRPGEAYRLELFEGKAARISPAKEGDGLRSFAFRRGRRKGTVFALLLFGGDGGKEQKSEDRPSTIVGTEGKSKRAKTVPLPSAPSLYHPPRRLRRLATRKPRTHRSQGAPSPGAPGRA